MHFRRTTAAVAGLLGTLALVPVALGVTWVEDMDHFNVFGQHLHAYVGAYLNEDSSCWFSQYQHSKGDTLTSGQYSHTYVTAHDTSQNTWASTTVTLWIDGYETEIYAYAYIWTNPTPPCSV